MFTLHYIDDIIISSNDKKCRQTFLNHLQKKLTITETGKLSRFVGIKCSENHQCGGKSWAIAAPGSIDKVVERFKEQDAHQVSDGGGLHPTSLNSMSMTGMSKIRSVRISSDL